MVNENWTSGGSLANQFSKADNEIKALKRSNGKWCYNEETLRTEAILCFQNLYTLEAHASGLFSVQMKFPFIETSLLNCIVRNLTSKEVRDALLEMAPLKASGADGLHAQFYQSQWSILGESLVSIVLKVFEGDDLILLFGEANKDTTDFMESVLKQFCNLSGHKVNAGKSKIYFSTNTEESVKGTINEQLWFQDVDDLDNYL
ncbi:hypothetical protein PVK06_035106 [Gossypium arboreum]|uniref:Reverse transcriptase n=1 Tax=Gossypium arboreum TaxID=29729 RepID=A0ABR0NFZ4_GOSAR|nr:hypothetical protein PVK06_035106 [Gossypium arboreum]